MAEVKIVIGTKKGICFQKTHDSTSLIGRKVGETLKGDLISIPGYEFLITGGSDIAGFPMRKEIKTRRAKIFARGGVGVHPKNKGEIIRKTVAGNTIDEKTAQINLKVSKEGTKKLEEIFGKKEASAEQPKKEKKPAKQETPKKEAKPKEAKLNENKS
ncbi:MAG: 30S ribosomal protein S6e [Nanoarchaeota archaeon]|nr:30S ribosomal protein S6e [Nanoarchaeota archaeon]